MSEITPTPEVTEPMPTPKAPNLYRRTEARFPRAVRAAKLTLAGAGLFAAGAGVANARNNKEALKEGVDHVTEGVEQIADSVTSTDES